MGNIEVEILAPLSMKIKAARKLLNFTAVSKGELKGPLGVAYSISSFKSHNHLIKSTRIHH